MKTLIHIAIIFLASLGATMFPLPVSFTDLYFIPTFNHFSLLLTIPVMLVSDAISALITYRLSYWLIPKLIRKQKHKEQMREIGNKINKWGWWVVFIAASTPFPYTLSIYAAGAVGWGTNRQLLSSVLLGKIIKYLIIGLMTYFGYKLNYQWLFSNYLNEVIVSTVFILLIITIELGIRIHITKHVRRFGKV